eukprot:TRINITY_DN6514_c0_g1_i1.p1 TRINITY_DN6514_c0_g1~~TRINITY_DN6514_c0_g1_i1.p1  ORF type:complete len:333 (+),score=205.63 TRINITY_DN6514_c0_g1_i1:175-1173(+)
MLSRALTTVARRSFSTTVPAATNVAVLGAAGGIGQPLSLLLKGNSKVSELRLYDVVNVPGVAADLSHISTPTKVKGFDKADLADALRGANVVLIPAGVPRKPGMTRDDLFNTNATIVKNLAEACAQYCPEAFILVIANPVNSTVPIVSQVFKNHKVYNPARLFGVTTLDVTRARTFVAEKKGLSTTQVNVPVIGGHAGTTILPLLSQATPNLTFTEAEIKELTNRIQFGGDEVVAAKNGLGSATLSMAYAAAEFTESLLQGLSGKSVVECTFVDSSVTSAPFFASKVELGPNGVQKVHGLGTLSAYEKQVFDEMLPTLKSQIEKGLSFVGSN